MEMSATGTHWHYAKNTAINTIKNYDLGKNKGNPEVYPVNCTDCVGLVGEKPCPNLPIGPAQTERICNIKRDVQPGSR